MEKMVHQAQTVDPAEMDHPDSYQDKQLHPKHAKRAPTHKLDPQEIQVLGAQPDRQEHPDQHPMAEAVEHPVNQDLKDPPDNQAHPETRVNQVFPAKSTNNPAKLDHPARAVNPVHPVTTVATVRLVSQVAMVPQDRTAKAVVQVATAKTDHPVARARKETEEHPVRATTAHHHAQHPVTNKPSVYVVEQHCQSHRRQRIVDIAMVGCWDDMILSQPPLLYCFRFAFLLLIVLAMSSSSEYQLE